MSIAAGEIFSLDLIKQSGRLDLGTSVTRGEPELEVA
jgi:hypothetical protein